MDKVEKVGVVELSSIQPGETKTFSLPTGSARASAQSQAYRMPVLHPRTGVVRYRCKSIQPSEGNFPVEITAVSYDEK